MPFYKNLLSQKLKYMTTKLRLTIDDQVIKNAKLFARRKGVRLSVIVENYLRLLVQEDVRAGGRVSRLRGVVRLPEGYDYKEEMEISKKAKISR